MCTDGHVTTVYNVYCKLIVRPWGQSLQGRDIHTHALGRIVYDAVPNNKDGDNSVSCIFVYCTIMVKATASTMLESANKEVDSSSSSNSSSSSSSPTKRWTPPPSPRSTSTGCLRRATVLYYTIGYDTVLYYAIL